MTGRQQLLAARGLAVGIGVIVVMLSTFIQHVPGNFLAVTNKTTNLLTVPIALLFLFALFVPFANAPGVWIATLASVVTAALAAFSGVLFGMDPVTGSDPISFQLIAPFSLAAGPRSRSRSVQAVCPGGRATTNAVARSWCGTLLDFR